jgi:ferredoxin--NADP+ reductase
MSRILSKTELAPKTFELVVSSRIARRAQPGQFVIAMGEERGERIPLTIADYDTKAETLTLVVMVVGTSSMKIADLEPGQSLYALIGPLGKPSHIDIQGPVLFVAGGVGTAPVYPIARAFHQHENKVLTVQGARTRELLFWEDKLRSVSDEYIMTTDDGSAGRRGLVTGPVMELLARAEPKIERVVAIGPTVMMQAVSEATRPFGVSTIVSLNTIMIDGTGMCGGCRVEVGGTTQFTCVDGPEFDGHQVAWEGLKHRQRVYKEQEHCSLNRYIESRAHHG